MGRSYARPFKSGVPSPRLMFTRLLSGILFFFGFWDPSRIFMKPKNKKYVLDPQRFLNRRVQRAMHAAFELSRFCRLFIGNVKLLDDMQSASYEQDMQPGGLHSANFCVFSYW